MTPEEIIARKNLVASTNERNDGALANADWMKFKAGVKDRAFWASRVSSLKFLRTCRDGIADVLANAKNDDGSFKSRAELVSSIMQAANDAGINTGSRSVVNPGSEARANVIIDTNAGLAAGYADCMRTNTYGARLAFPAQELVRVEEREKPRDWHKKWVDKGGTIYPGNRMIALKDDPIWTDISAFGVPYPPFDYNSGMGVDDISYDEAVELGVIKPDYEPPKDSPLKSFNADLRADMEFKNDKDWRDLSQIFGDQIRENSKEIIWRQEAVKDAFLHKRHFELDLGIATQKLKDMLPKDRSGLVDDKSFNLDSKWLFRKRRKGKNHFDHFEPLEKHPNNIPLTADDLELLPILFREPDMVLEGDTATSFINVLHDGAGGNYCLILDAADAIRVKTYLKLKPGVDIREALKSK